MIECDYSFEMLYRAAYGRKIPSKVKKKFQALSQEEVNKLVMTWAQVANWRTELKMGEQGVVYLAFYP